MDLYLLRARKPDSQHKKQKQKLKGYCAPQSHSGLAYPANKPKPGIVLSAISLIMLLMAAGTTQSTSSPEPLQCKAEADKTPVENFIFF